MVYVGVFVTALCCSALAALYTPKRKVKWGEKTAPKAITTINVKKEK